MINSNTRKLNLSGWLLKNNKTAFESPLKLQKFVLFYELFSFIDNDDADFSYLKGWKKGPVFSALWGDYTKDRQEFITKCKKVNDENNSNIDEERVMITNFLTSILNERDLSDLTHKLNLWNSKSERILSGEKQVSLDISDFNSNDIKMMKILRGMYPMELINNTIILPINENYILIPKKDYDKLTEEHMDILSDVVQSGNLHNPVFVDIDENGVMEID